MNQNLCKWKKVVIIFLIIMIASAPFARVYAAINPDNMENVGTDIVKNVLGGIMAFSLGPLGAAIATLINVILLVVVTLLSLIFMPISSGILFPTPDDIIFNRLAFFDPNFIDVPKYSTGAEATNWITKLNGGINGMFTAIPGVSGEIEKAPVVLLKDVIKNIYFTSFAIAGTVFVIAAMLIGIKLALSTIASEKAHYKEALMTWVKGILLLFLAHFLILAIFKVNEIIVVAISRAASNITFTMNIFESIPLVGSTVGKLVSGILGGLKSLIDATGINSPDWIKGDITLSGYMGMIIMFIGKAIGGDLSASIICGIIIGQTCTLTVMYIKRLFYCIILGMIAPLIVAADVLKKSI